MAKRRSINPSTRTIKYTGSVRLPATSGDNTTTTTMLAGTAVAQLNGAGEFKALFPTNSVSTLPEWVNWTQLYQEYRVLGIRLEYKPYQLDGYVSTTQTPSLGVVANYHEAGGTLPASMAVAVENATSRLWSTGESLTLEWKMDGVDESGFIPTSGSAQFGGVYIFTDGGTPGFAPGRYIVRYLVQFKGRK